MRLSQNFTKTRREAPAGEVSKNAQLLIRAGFIHKEMAGVYAYLPLGLRVLENIKAIIRGEMNSLGAQELIMTSLQSKKLWQKTDRWDDNKVDVWFKSQLKNGTQVGFGWSHEEPISAMMKNYISSYRDLPANVYQFQTKLRNELRAKSGIMRGREFVMKDLYSYSRSEAEHQAFYETVTASYLRIFKRVGLGDETFFTFASGGAFTQFSHEFQTLSEAGEDTIYLDRGRKLAVNEEVLTDEVLAQLKLKRDNLEMVKAAEVGNIFSFGTVKSEQLGLHFSDESGVMKPVVLGSYGIGVTRLMGMIVERFADKAGIVWPASVAPAQVQLIILGDDTKVRTEAEKLYVDLQEEGLEVLFDDRAESAGAKFADADLMGLPNRIVVSAKTLAKGSAELKPRNNEEAKLVKLDKLVEQLAKR